MSEHSLSTPGGPDVALFTPGPGARVAAVRSRHPDPSEATMADPTPAPVLRHRRRAGPPGGDRSVARRAGRARGTRTAQRFLAAVRALDAADWDHATRCADWSVRDVVAHLVTVDGFWPVTLAAARDDGDADHLSRRVRPVELARPVRAGDHRDDDGPRAARAARRRARRAAHVRRRASTTTPGSRRCESPLGHVPARLILAHGYWDSWLHEYDVFVPLGDAPAGRARRPPRRDVVQPRASRGCRADSSTTPTRSGPVPTRRSTSASRSRISPTSRSTSRSATLGDGVAVARCASDHAPVDAGRAVDLVEGLDRSPADRPRRDRPRSRPTSPRRSGARRRRSDCVATL